MTRLQSPPVALRPHNSQREMDSKIMCRHSQKKTRKINLHQRKPCHSCASGPPCWGQQARPFPLPPGQCGLCSSCPHPSRSIAAGTTRHRRMSETQKGKTAWPVKLCLGTLLCASPNYAARADKKWKPLAASTEKTLGGWDKVGKRYFFQI